VVPASDETLPHEILHDAPAAPELPAGASAYAAPDVPAVPEGITEDDAVNSSIIVERPARKLGLPRVVVAKPADTLPQILQALGTAARDVEAISALLAPKSWFKTKAFEGGEKIVVEADDAEDQPQAVLRPIRVSIERAGAPPVAVARSDDGRFVPVASLGAADRSNASGSAAEITTLRPATDESLREALYAMANANGVDHALIDSMVRLCARDVDLDTSLSGNDTAELLYGPNDLGAPELAFAALTIAGHVHRYYRFTAPDDGSTDYYDANGHSVTQSLLRKPVAAGRLGDGYGWRMHPVLGVRRLHEGVDYAAPFGSPIVAAGAGTVELISQQIGYGKYIRVRHDLGYETTYAHISSTARGLHVGSRVRQGETIAFVGSTGYSTGPHLYYELRINGRNVDPLRVKLRAGRVLDGSMLAAFESTRERADVLLRTSTTDGERG
jgi:murein DD-endopeptidase MepM/ murein hydrolase activator NlpD